ncbi:hypothetical protein AXE65_05585 [Ventosimonas gracilis]|uniref:DUF805 domain-containing protein n=1 Tax=Ventosimonas gracilis TaxID=1680762 RepID=A0A139SNH3_9GAMM|nr:DUF805 domain-containing protein [Ventosimonas gracilis]KXU36125.1 hypothetical protein AXE65_05585 [Ventosimonas gracilis]
MCQPRYKIIFSGEPLPTVSDETLKANLAQLFKISLEEAQQLMYRGEITLKRDLPEAEAERYLAALQNAGAVCHKEAAELALVHDEALEQAKAAEAERLAQEAEQQAAEAAQGTPLNPYLAPKAAVFDENDERFAEALNPYSAEGRIGRLRYLAWLMASTLVIGIPLFVVTSLLSWISSSLSALAMLLFVAGGIMLIVCDFRFAIQRLHDLGFSAWWVLLHFVPIAGSILPFVLMLAPGSSKRNIYGPPPPPNSLAVQFLAALWLLPIVFGLLSLLFR